MSNGNKTDREETRILLWMFANEKENDRQPDFAGPGRIHKEYRLPFADLGVNADLREVKKHADYNSTREEILNMIWNMEEEIMGRAEESA